MELNDLEIYKLAREISKEAWMIYNKFDWRTKKIMGDQFITAIDSIGGNIAEGFGRFHYLDRNKFNYNARGSLIESLHWLNLLYEREKIDEKLFKNLNQKLTKLSVKLNNYISSTKSRKTKNNSF
jgi:four helix bundle protein